MFARIRIALGLALLLSLFTSITVFAKGGFFSFITVAGVQLTDEVRITDLALTEDYFTFADFYQNKTEAPTDPGLGYEITRYYVNESADTAFDTLHYYPETGYVYYDGIVSGSSEYDGKWYIAQSGIKSAFETALYMQIRLMNLGTPEGSRMMVPPAEPSTVAAIPQTQSILPVVLTAGLAMLLAVSLLRSRKIFSR